ncbi:glycoside hydrolase family 99-like domain-containing protein [Flavisolibacter sp. BT320]|nr:glycoside hydrolase family 99-like domain-containing protein [Flavisolibacter longurius]
MIKPIALYLPQYHPLPENDRWWGKGFTEWTNVTKASPLFNGHWQPRLPADLGFYDLRVPEVRQAQADLARQHGIYGFCYWHYWFAGKQLLERPLKEVVENRKPDFPFCVAWANQTWSGTWHGVSNGKVLVEQTYPGDSDNIAHFYALLPALRDTRYITVNGKKVIFIFRPMEIPEPQRFIDCWQELAVKEGLGGLHLVGMHMPEDWDPKWHGYDAVVQNWINRDLLRLRSATESLAGKVQQMLRLTTPARREVKPLLVSYKAYVEQYDSTSVKPDTYPMVYADWDNTPRSGREGWLFRDFSPARFEQACAKALAATANKPACEQIVVIKSWNEWAEGNYLEPDQRYGLSLLQAFQKALHRFQQQKSPVALNSQSLHTVL